MSILVLPRIPWWTCDVSSQNVLNVPRELNFLPYKFNFTQLYLASGSWVRQQRFASLASWLWGLLKGCIKLPDCT